MVDTGAAHGFSRAAPGVRPPPTAQGPLAPGPVSGRYHPLSSAPEEEDTLPGVPLLGGGDLGALDGKPAAQDKDKDTEDEDEQRRKDIEQRCKRVVDNHKAANQELHQLSVRMHKLQGAAWAEEAMARRERRRPRPEPLKAYMKAVEEHDRLKVEKRVLQEYLANCKDSPSDFLGHP